MANKITDFTNSLSLRSFLNDELGNGYYLTLQTEPDKKLLNCRLIWTGSGYFVAYELETDFEEDSSSIDSSDYNNSTNYSKTYLEPFDSNKWIIDRSSDESEGSEGE